MLQRVAFVLALLAFVVAAPAAGQNPKFITGDVQLGWIETLVPPELRCAGGEPTGLPFPMCSEDTARIFGRSEVQTWFPFYPTAPIERLVTGPITFVVNCNFSPQYRGPCWGTFRWEIAGIGVWEGHWTSPLMDLLTYESKIVMEGHGAGGEIDGMQIKFEGASAPGDWFVAGKIRIH